MTYSVENIERVYNALQPECKAIYLGGSAVESYINNPHDIDFICFAQNEMARLRMLVKLIKYQKVNASLFTSEEDWLQTRSIDNEEQTYGSYIYRDMQLVAGEAISFKLDILGGDYNKYIDILKTNINTITNTKRFYQLYRGALIVSKNSYELTDEEKDELNQLHDKTASEELINKVKELINRLEYRYVEQPEQDEQLGDDNTGEL